VEEDLKKMNTFLACYWKYSQIIIFGSQMGDLLADPPTKARLLTGILTLSKEEQGKFFFI